MRLRLPAWLLIAATAVPPVLAMLLAGSTVLDVAPDLHFWAVVSSGGIAAASAFALSAAGAQQGDGRVVLMGSAFAAMGTLLVVHGFSTPGVLAGSNGVIAIAGAAVLPVGGLVLSLTSLGALRGPDAVRVILRAEVLLVTAIVLFGVVGLRFPDALPSVPAAGSIGAWAVLLVAVGAFLPVTLRAARTCLLTHRRSDLAVVVGLSWLAVAVFPQLLLEPGRLAWWIGHALELLGIALAAAPVALDLHRARSSRPLLGDLRTAELVAAEEAFLGSRVRALMLMLTRKDPSTEKHTRRVALLAVDIAEELGLPPARLRDLAIGGLLHDMGKLSVPDEILMKPAALSDEEFAVIKQHPSSGHDLLQELGGFSPMALELVLDHHERLDGSGYPRGLTGGQLSLEVRILAVCDVYDALVSDRVYRPAWPKDEALALLRHESGTAFDPRCVRALARVLARGVPDPAPVPEPPSRSLRLVPLALATVIVIAGLLAGAATAGESAGSEERHEGAHQVQPEDS